jgi:uncharacterized protein YqeY
LADPGRGDVFIALPVSALSLSRGKSSDKKYRYHLSERFILNSKERPMSVHEGGSYGWSPDSGLPLPEKIRADLKTALRNKDHGVRDTLRQIISEFPSLTVPIRLESGKKTTRPKRPEEITDEDVLDIVRKLVKNEKIVLEAKKEEHSEYLETLERYLPRMVSREEIAAWIRANVDFSQFKSPMQAMRPVMQHFGKLADGSLVKELLQEMSG